MVKALLSNWEYQGQRKEYLHFARIDKVETFDHLEGILFWPIPIYYPD